MGSDTDTWSYKAGERGRNRVRAYEKARDGTLYLEWWEPDPQTGKRKRKRLSLDVETTDEAKAKADTLAARFAQMDPDHDEKLTVGGLFDIFKSERGEDVGDQRAKVYDRVSEAMTAVLGSQAPVNGIDRTDWDHYQRVRQKGIIDCRGRRVPEEDRKPVSARIVEKDLQVLRAACNWAVGADLLDVNPTDGYPLPDATNTPRRPSLSEKRYRAMLEVASTVGWRFRTAFVLCHETGHRSKSVRRLRWADVEPLDAREVHWRGGEDKTGHDHVTDTTDAAVEVLQDAREHRPGVGEAWILPNPVDASRPVTRHQLRRWWLEAEDEADVDHVDGLGWHALRRKFADDLRELPLKDLAAAGGWQEEQTVVECYQSPDRDRIRGALEERSTGGGGVG